jgi:hypothetical protein
VWRLSPRGWERCEYTSNPRLGEAPLLPMLRDDRPRRLTREWSCDAGPEAPQQKTRSTCGISACWLLGRHTGRDHPKWLGPASLSPGPSLGRRPRVARRDAALGRGRRRLPGRTGVPWRGRPGPPRATPSSLSVPAAAAPHDLDGAQRHAQQALAVAHSIRCEPDVLSSIAYVAHVWARRGNVEPALRALLHVDHHPAALARDKNFNAPLLAALREALAPASITAAA